MNVPIITAHSGCEGTDIDSFDSPVMAVQCGADAAEIDIRMDECGILRLSHNPKPDQSVYNSCVPLEKVLAFAAEHQLTLNCDIKEPGIIHDVLALAKKHSIPREHLWITGSITPAQLACDPGLLRSARFFLNIEEIFKYLYLRECDRSQLAEFAQMMLEPWQYTKQWRREVAARIEDITAIWRASGADGLNLPYQCMSEDALIALRDRQIPVSVWTVDDPEITHRLLAFDESNIVNLTTRQVRQTQRIRTTQLGF